MLSLLKSLLENNSTLFNVSIALLIIYLVYYIRNIVSYPRGPLPLPILGNILHFRGKMTDPITPFDKLLEWSNKFGPVYTFWAGHTPIVMVNSFELSTEASIVKKNDFIDRPKTISYEIFRSGSQNIFATDGPYWESLRKVALFAIRKFAMSDRLPHIISEVMDDASDLMLKQRKMDPILYVDFMVYNVLAMTAYGERFGSIDDEVFKDAKRLNTEFYELAGNGLIPDYMSWTRPFYYKRELGLREVNRISVQITKNTFLEHKKTFTPGVIRDFADCVLEAKEEAIRENFERNKYLNDDNLFMVISDLFVAGTDTTQTTMRWSILMLANDQKLQQKIFEEIRDNIGDRIATQDDKNILPLTYAFVLEVLRYRPPAPLGVEHSSSVDTELGGHKIPKNTHVIFNLYQQNNDPKYWSNPEKFDPTRFLDSEGKLKSGRFPSFLTFGLGRRGCPGDKLAYNNNFLMVTRLLQRVKIELSTGEGTANVMPQNMLTGCFPRDYQIICSQR